MGKFNYGVRYTIDPVTTSRRNLSTSHFSSMKKNKLTADLASLFYAKSVVLVKIKVQALAAIYLGEPKF